MITEPTEKFCSALKFTQELVDNIQALVNHDSLAMTRARPEEDLEKIMTTIFDDLDSAFLARDLHRLRREITEQSDLVMRAAGIDIPSSCTSLVLTLGAQGKSVSDLSETLGYSHQLTTQRVNILLELGLIVKRKMKDDGRKKCVILTAEGQRQAERLSALLPQIDDALSAMFVEIGVSLSSACREALSALEASPILKRIDQNILEEASVL